MEEVRGLVRRFRKRLLLCAGLTGLLWGGLAGLPVIATGAYLVRAGALSVAALLPFVAVILCASALLGLIKERVRQDAVSSARHLDWRARTQDLFASSLDFAERDLSGPAVEFVLRRAGASSRSIRVRRLSPVRSPFPGWVWLTGLALVFACIIAPLPEETGPAPSGQALAERLPIEIAHEQQSLRLEAKRVVQELSRSDEERDRRSAEELEKLWDRLESGELARNDLIEAAGELAKERIITAGDELRNLLAELREIARAFSSVEGWREAAQELAQGKVHRFAHDLREKAKRLGDDGASQDDGGRLALALARAGEGVGRFTEELGRSFAGAGESLSLGDRVRAGNELQDAADELDRVRSELDRMETLARAMEHLQALKRLAREAPAPLEESERLSLASRAGGAPESPGGERAVGALEGEGSKNRSASGEGVGSTAEGPGTGQPSETDAARLPARVPGMLSGTGDVASVILRSARFDGEAHIEYRRVVQSARETLEASLSDERIPFGRRDLVRRYFQSILPEERDLAPESRDEGQ